ncbi:MAG: hypothetical protein LKJ90_06175 [Faecalibacterium sp.]|jgi:hypothetical protein|nr:hypothetical protein [Faecalibacterium sp.]
MNDREKEPDCGQNKNFKLTITGTDYGEWQGYLTGEDGEKVMFRSLLELMRAIRRVMEKAPA